ncbi:MAG: 1-acyl-sn-glycerol-3-phosphate acyltransferase [Bacteroidales bacterium]|nr:1-acyl-sn-glycerol-3-phosphate acyltransferase [Bacteroidales bacterium]
MPSGIKKILTVPVFGLLYIYTAIGVLLVIPLSWFNARKPVQVMVKYWAKSVFIIMFTRLRVKGKENVNKKDKYILIANHSSLFDIIAIASLYPEVSWFGHERLMKIPVFRSYLKLIEYIPFKEPTIKNTRQMLEQLVAKTQDRSIAIFPEGTRTLNGRISPFYRGFIYLFRTREIGILPITLKGFYDLKPKNRFYINFGSRLELIIHKPIPREELIDRSDEEIIDAVKNVIESAYC